MWNMKIYDIETHSHHYHQLGDFIMIDKQRVQDAKAGNVKEQFSVGMYYYEGAFGLGENIDYEKALFWLTKAAEQDMSTLNTL